jgi:hypothetical protein
MSDLDRGCNCTMPEDWGSGGGFHYRPITQEYLEKHRLPASYLGEPIAVEPCPAFRQAVQKRMESENRHIQKTSTRRRVLSES